MKDRRFFRKFDHAQKVDAPLCDAAVAARWPFTGCGLAVVRPASELTRRHRCGTKTTDSRGNFETPWSVAGKRRTMQTVLPSEFKRGMVLLLDGRLLDIALPPSVTLQVVDTAPPIRGGSDATWKPARLDTGLEILVPVFIATGEKIRVETTERKYARRESEGKK